MPGGAGDIATENAEKDFERMTKVPVVFANHRTAGHVGAFDEPHVGSYARFSLEWPNIGKGKE